MAGLTLSKTDTVTESSDAPEVLRFDRRRHERHVVSGRITALRRDHRIDAYRHPVCSLQMVNMSDGGLAATCDIALDVDESVAVFFPPHGPERGFDLYGHVVRCLPGEHGYALAIQFDHKAAA